MEFPLLIDGGLSNELESRGCDLNHKLWSARILESNPEALIATHLAYLNAGAHCIATASYQASFEGYRELDYDRSEAAHYILKSVELAQEAVRRFTKDCKPNYPIYVAASIGPYGAYLADGSEYHGNYTLSDQELHKFHYDRIALLDNSGADLLAIETIPNYQEAVVLAEILAHTSKKSWISFSCKDGKHINDGSLVKKCVQLLDDHPNVFALGINCTHPKYISELIAEIKNVASDKKILVYPNSGEAYNAKTKSWLGTSDPALFKLMAAEWLELGADMIGGCCRIGPEHIRQLDMLISDRKST